MLHPCPSTFRVIDRWVKPCVSWLGGADKSLSVLVDRDTGMGAKGAHPAWQQPPGAHSTPGEKLWWGRGEQGSARSLLRPWKLQEFHFWGYFLKTRGVGRRQGDRGTRLVLGL